MFNPFKFLKYKQTIEDQKKIIADLEYRVKVLRFSNQRLERAEQIFIDTCNGLESKFKDSAKAAEIGQVTLAHLLDDQEITDPAVSKHTRLVLQEINKLLGCEVEK
jgi:hypothetical protein